MSARVSTGTSPPRRPAEAGPPLPLVAGITTGLVLAGIVVPAVVAGATFPSPFLDDRGALPGFVAGEARAVQLSAFFLFAASVPLAVLTAALTGRLHGLGVRAAGPAIALAGGLLASAGLALCAAAQWALARTGDGAPAALVRALADVAFVTGGPWHVVGLGLLLAGVAVSAAFTGLLPRPVWQAGVVLAVVCELSTLVLLVPGAAYLLPVGRFGGLAWLVVAAVLLPRRRPARAGGRP